MHPVAENHYCLNFEARSQYNQVGAHTRCDASRSSRPMVRAGFVDSISIALFKRNATLQHDSAGPIQCQRVACNCSAFDQTGNPINDVYLKFSEQVSTIRRPGGSHRVGNQCDAAIV